MVTVLMVFRGAQW